MEERQELAVHGFVRRNYNRRYPDDVITIIYTFYLLRMESNILDFNEQMSLMNLLFEALGKQKGNESIKSIHTSLLFRASEHGHSAKLFRVHCDHEGPNIVIMHNEHEHVYGAYKSKSWDKEQDWTDDENAFLFVVRPTVKVFGLKKGEETVEGAICYYSGFGPMFGRGNDLWVSHKCHEKKIYNGCSSLSNQAVFHFDANELCGVGTKEKRVHRSQVNEYEVFSVACNTAK